MAPVTLTEKFVGILLRTLLPSMGRNLVQRKSRTALSKFHSISTFNRITTAKWSGKRHGLRKLKKKISNQKVSFHLNIDRQLPSQFLLFITGYILFEFEINCGKIWIYSCLIHVYCVRLLRIQFVLWWYMRITIFRFIYTFEVWFVGVPKVVFENKMENYSHISLICFSLSI